MAPTVQVVTEELYGWRQWNLQRTSAGNPILVSPYRDTEWYGPVQVSDQVPDLTEEERTPPKPKEPEKESGGLLGFWTGGFTLSFGGGHENQHGIHAWRSRDRLVRTDTISVQGAVALSGTVVEGEKGYRAERATIAALWLIWPTLSAATKRLSEWDPMRLWRDSRAIEVIGALEERYQCPVEMYDAQGLKAWRP